MSTEPPRRERSTAETADQALARPRRGRGERRDRRRLPRPHARPARPPRPARPAGRGERRPRDRRPPHGRGRRHRARAGARRGARRPRRDPPLRLGRWCRWTSRWPSARSTSPGGPYCVFDADLPTTSIAGFDTELAEEFFRAVANSAKLTLHVSVRYGHQRPPHDRGLLQGLRPGPARRRLDRPRGERRALDQGDPERVTRRGSRSSTTGWATCARSRRRSSTSAPTADDHRRRRPRCAPPTALILPGVGAFPRAMERIRERGLDELIAERRDGRRADPRHLPRPAAALRLDHRARRRRRARPARRARSPSSTPTGLKVPHIGWSPVRWERESRLAEGIESETPFYFVHSFAPRARAGELLGSAAYGDRFACAAERDNVFGVQFHPEKSSAAGLRLLANFAGICAVAAARRDPLPGDRHPRRPGGAPAAGRLRARDRLRRRPGRRRAALGRRRRRVPARRRPRRRARRASRGTSRRCGGSPPRSSARSRSAAACATPTRVAAVLDAGAERVVIGTAALRDPDFLDRDARARTASGVVVSVDARGGKVSLAGWTEASGRDVAEAVAELGERGVAALPLHRDRGRRDDGGPGASTSSTRSPPATAARR